MSSRNAPHIARRPKRGRPADQGAAGGRSGTVMSRICQLLLALGLIGILHLAETGKINLSARPEKKGTVAAVADGNAPGPPVADGNGPGPDPEELLRQADNHDGRDEVQAIFFLSKAADLGNAEAQYRLGRICARGEGLLRNTKKALALYHKAAEQGHAEAQYLLARLYARGEGVTLDGEKALALSRKAAEQGHVKAQYLLAVCLQVYGAGPRDKAEAAQWYRRAAEQGDAESGFELGLLYETGNGVPRDATQAAVWYRKAAEQGYAPAQCNLGLLYYEGNGVPQDTAQAFAWYRKAAEQGNEAAQFNLGTMYARGESVARDVHEAARWINKAAEQGHEKALRFMQYDIFRTAHEENLRAEQAERDRPAREALLRRAQEGDAQACLELGNAHDRGLLGLPRDRKQAALWYGKAGEQGMSEAQERLARMYHTGDDIPRDMAQAIRWYRKLAEQDNDGTAGAALKTLGKIYAAGDGVPRDTAQAVNCFREAALRHDREAPFLLGRMYAAGDGVPRDMDRAIRWYCWAAAYNDEAKRELGRIHAAGDGVPRAPWTAAVWYDRVSPGESALSGEARQALTTLHVDVRALKRCADVIDPILTTRMALARFELVHAFGETSDTPRGRSGIVGVHEEAERLVSRVPLELKRLKDRNDDLPPPIADMGRTVYREALESRRDILFALGRLYIEGRGVAKNLSDGLYHYRRAARLGDSRARAALRALIPDIVPAGAKATAAGGEEGAVRHAGRDTATCPLADGIACWTGDGVPVDRTQAVKHFRKALALGCAEAARLLARCCFFGEGTTESDAETLFHLLMYEALRGLRNRSTPLPEVEAALKRCCVHLLPRSSVEDVRRRRDKELAAIRQRMTAR